MPSTIAPTPTSPSTATTSAVVPAAALLGLTVNGGWKVVTQFTPSAGATGGTFSFGYIVEDGTGKQAFLKALDYSSAMSAPDPARVLQGLTAAYNFERDVLAKCRDRRMDRVVRAIDDGSITVTFAGKSEVVQYLILEKADADARSFVSASASFDVAWTLRALHHIATGLRQMHMQGIAHQDLKPSNVLVFDKSTSKVSDVGRASMKGATSPFDGLAIPGDLGYAAPELLYDKKVPDWAGRLAADCYLLGSMLHFLFATIGTTPAIIGKMLAKHHWRTWSGTYAQVLPFVRDAFDLVANEFELRLQEKLRADLGPIFRQLCDPDPALRGHPRDRAMVGNANLLERYVGQFNTLASNAESKMFA